MSISAEALLGAFREMKLGELSAFIRRFEDEFGVTAAAPVVASVPGPAVPEAEPVPDERDVVLVSAGTAKIQVIKEVRALLSLGLKDAKDYTDTLPRTVLEKVPAEQAEAARARLAGAGAEVRVQ